MNENVNNDLLRQGMSINIYNFGQKEFQDVNKIKLFDWNVLWLIKSFSIMYLSVINFKGITIVQSSTKNKFLSTLHSCSTYLEKMRQIRLNKIILSYRVKEKNKLSCLGRFGMLGKFWLGNTRQQQLNRIVAWPLSVGDFYNYSPGILE